nr:immunoglobulin heavy chain junction region [Macaca mulatta]MOY21672.1 immunoglobulin heavy chain junction region [Macaca mulatta]MOY23512.1 immunoglobulin heavy chain junction region [Macaca mulatta]MOY24315.1 immunoglobulin heavy chain junction region [Macaca mulatta]MOY25617.1 immunoglobulin heavy chain junction region [Macaca mulatta]
CVRGNIAATGIDYW